MKKQWEVEKKGPPPGTQNSTFGAPRGELFFSFLFGGARGPPLGTHLDPKGGPKTDEEKAEEEELE